MRKVTFGGAVSLDNFIAADNDAMDWLLWGDETVEVMNEYWPRIDTILMGRKTWEVSRQNAPPESSSVDGGGIATYVFSRTLTPDAAPGATVISENAGDFVRELKSQPGKEICMWEEATSRVPFSKPTSSTRWALISIRLYWVPEYPFFI